MIYPGIHRNNLLQGSLLVQSCANHELIQILHQTMTNNSWKSLFCLSIKRILLVMRNITNL